MEKEFLTLSEFSQRVQKPLGSVYHLSRRDAIPGQVRVSERTIRIHWPSYVASVTGAQTAA